MKIVPRCAGVEEDGISGVGPLDHSWVEVSPYVAPNPVDGQPARWSDLACEKCGAIQPGWERIADPLAVQP